jgi:outer membrane protein assembly factor BamB
LRSPRVLLARIFGLLALVGALHSDKQVMKPQAVSSSDPIPEVAVTPERRIAPTTTPRAAVERTATPTFASIPATENEWPQYRHDIQRSGRASDTLQLDPGNGVLHLQWAYSFGERVEIEVEPIVATGKVFVGAMNGAMTALNAYDGSLAWHFTQAGPIPHSAAYADGRLFFGSLDGNVYALDATNGALLWKMQTGGPVYAAPAVADGNVYIGSTAGRFFALDSSSGAQRWSFPTGQAHLPTAFTGAAALSPDGQRIYVGNEDLLARALDTKSGSLLWQQQLLGVGMRSAYPVVADDGATVIFVTSKPGIQSYVPTENYPKAEPGSDPALTWNRYYRSYPERRATFFLDAASGAELWNSTAARYVPLPLPYWGLLEPVLDDGGNAWFAISGGATGSDFGDFSLDHDSRLVRVELDDGVATQVAARGDFQLRMDENGRATFAGDHYLTTISEDLGAYDTAGKIKATLFGNGFDSHMDPLAPLPSPHLWRYGGAIAMGGVPGASPPVVAGGMVFYVSYGWLFALGAADRGLDPSGAQPIRFLARNTRLHNLTYPQTAAPSIAELQAELDRRVIDLIASADSFPYARFEQAGRLMQDEISGFQIFGQAGERIWILTQALPQLSPGVRAQALSYLRRVAQAELFDPDQYSYRRDCLIYGQVGTTSGAACEKADIVAAWFADNELLVGERLYAMAAYGEATGDWSLIDANWSMITGLFGKFTAAYDRTLGLCVFPKWHVGKLGLASQIGAAAGVLRMAERRGDSGVVAQAQALLDSLLAARVRLAHYIRDQYDAGVITAQPLRIDPDGVPNRDDIFKYNDPGELLPLGGDRDRASDTRQLTWHDGGAATTHSSAGFMHFAALVGYSPLYPELAAKLRSDLLLETRRYVQTYEVNAPWWWMNDLAHHTTTGGEHLWHSPTLAHDLFQTKAWVLGEDWDTLRRQLPLPMSTNSRYDLYRLHNLATLLALRPGDLSGTGDLSNRNIDIRYAPIVSPIEPAVLQAQSSYTT